MTILEKNVCVEHQFEGYRVGYRVGMREPRGNCNPCLENGRILKHPVFKFLNFRGWIKHIFDTVD